MMVVTCWIPRSQSNLLTGPRPLDNYPDSPDSGVKPPAAHVINISRNQQALVGAERSGVPRPLSECGGTCTGPHQENRPAPAFGSWPSLACAPGRRTPRMAKAQAKEEGTKFLSLTSLYQRTSTLFPLGAAWKVTLRPPQNNLN